MNCKQCEEMLSDFLDDTLDDSERLSLGMHLRECVPCCMMRIEVAAIISLGREIRMEQSPPPNANALWARVTQSLGTYPQGSLTTD
jgi:hypothetical protein